MKRSPTNVWRYITPIRRDAGSFNNENDIVNDTKVIANLFNRYFKSVFTHDDGLAPNCESYYGCPPIENVFVGEAGVLALLLNLDDKKSSVPDEISNAFLKRYAEWCAKYLSIIFQKTLDTAWFPRDSEVAKTVPIF